VPQLSAVSPERVEDEVTSPTLYLLPPSDHAPGRRGLQLHALPIAAGTVVALLVALVLRSAL
jgi:hypothetical protein